MVFKACRGRQEGADFTRPIPLLLARTTLSPPTLAFLALPIYLSIRTGSRTAHPVHLTSAGPITKIVTMGKPESTEGMQQCRSDEE